MMNPHSCPSRFSHRPVLMFVAIASTTLTLGALPVAAQSTTPGDAVQSLPLSVPSTVPASQPVITQPTSDASYTDAGYLLGAGDRLRLEVYNVAELSRDYEILADGSINLPLVGTVAIQGMTLRQASELVAQRLSRYIRTPVVNLNLTEVRPLKVAIAGQVNRPGSYTLPARSENGVPTLTQLIQQAGGITQIANIRDIQIRRLQPQNAAAPVVINVSLWNLAEGGDLTQDLPLRDGDTISIPTATALNPEEVTTVAAASFSPSTIAVNVVGEVERPGVIQVTPNTPLTQAILAAGGFNDKASRGTVDFIRLNPNGTISRREIRVDFAQQVSDVHNPALRNQDTIIVRRSGTASLLTTLGSVLSPISGLANILRLFGL